MRILSELLIEISDDCWIILFTMIVRNERCLIDRDAARSRVKKGYSSGEYILLLAIFLRS